MRTTFLEEFGVIDSETWFRATQARSGGEARSSSREAAAGRAIVVNPARELAGLRLVRGLGRRLESSRIAVIAAERYVRDRLEFGDGVARAAAVAGEILVREFCEREAPCPTAS